MKLKNKLSKRFAHFSLPAVDLAVSAELQSMLVVDPKLAVLFIMGAFIKSTVTTLKEMLCACQKCLQGWDPEDLWEWGHPKPSLISSSEKDAEETVCHSFPKTCKSPDRGPVSLLSLETVQLAAREEQRSFLSGSISYARHEFALVSISRLILHLDSITWQQ